MARNWDTSNRSIRSKLLISASLVSCCLASQVFASGFAILEQSTTLLGTAYSGTAALAEDASTGYYNPAGLTRLGESEIVLSGILITGDFDFTASSARVSIPTLATALGGQPNPLVAGDNQDDPGTVNLVPSFHLSKRLDERWVLGFNLTAPWGLDSEYQDTGIARYLATRSSLQTLNFSPSIAYEINSCFAIGAGVDAEWGRADLEAKVGTGNASLDGFQKNHLHGWGYGWHAGLLWTPLETTRVGLQYRSHVNFRGEGNSENLVPYTNVLTTPGVIGFGPTEGIYSIQRVHANLTLPEIATLSLYHSFNTQFAVTGDIAWTNWSRFHTLRIRMNPGATLPILANTGQGIIQLGNTPGLDTDTWEHFKDSRRYALGLIYTYDSHWKFRAGTAYDESPVRDEFRTARLPDSDRYWIAVGAQYNVNKALHFDVGYAHLFFEDCSINEAAPFIAPSPGNVIQVTSNPRITGATLAGDYKNGADLFGVQLRYNFV